MNTKNASGFGLAPLLLVAMVSTLSTACDGSSSQAPMKVQATLEGPESSGLTISDFVVTTEDRPVLAGSLFVDNSTYPDYDYDARVAGFSATGQQQWEKLFDSELLAEDAVDLGPTADGGVVALLSGPPYCYADPIGVALVKLDDAGNQEWMTLFDGQNCRTGLAAAETRAGAFLVVGTQKQGDETSTWLALVDAKGKQVWLKTFPSDSLASLETIGISEPTLDAFLIAGASYEDQVLLLRVDAAGKLLSEKSLTVPYPGMWVKELVPMPDGGFVALGSVTLPNYLEITGLWRVDPQGKTLWKRTWGLSGYADTVPNDLLFTAEGELLVLGTRIGYYFEGYYQEILEQRPFLACFDAAGQRQWSTTWADTEPQFMAQSSDSSVLVLSSTWPNLQFTRLAY
jgi:hypothetical protein